jgi:hypothetical protein
MNKNPFLSIDKRILADSGSSDESAKNLFMLCDQIGPRFAGTDGHRRAADFMLNQFEQYGLENTALEPFDFTAWRRGEPAEFSMTDPLVKPYDCYTLPYSAATGPGGVCGELLDIGSGSHRDIETHRKKIKGRFVLTTCSGAHRTETLARCASLGAIGFIYSSPLRGMILATGCVASSSEDTIPAISIGYESGLQIQRLSKNSAARFRLATHATFEPSATCNVIGELAGTEFPEELVIMGGHVDSHEIGPCAFDNAAGAVQVMETARLLAKQRKHLKRTIRFIGFGAEEVGLLGSHHHAKKHAAQLQKARFMLNSDCPSMGRPKGLSFQACPKAETYIATLAEQMGSPILHHDRYHCYSDHYPFILQGVPTAGMAGGSFGAKTEHFMHMAGDTADKISLVDLREGAAFAAQFLLRAASDEDWPRMRRSPAQVKKLLASG